MDGICCFVSVKNGAYRVYFPNEATEDEWEQVDCFLRGIRESALIFWEDLE